MVDRIINAYRAQIYDWTLADAWKIIKQNWKLWTTILVAMLAIVALFIGGLACQKLWMISAAIILEAIVVIRADRYAVKQHRRALERKTEHLEDVAEFLKTAIPGVDFYDSDRIGELINRLTGIIEDKKPFARMGRNLKSFATTIAVPIISFVAGVCSNYLQQQDISVILAYGIGAIITIAFVWAMASMLIDFIRHILCRDFDAAVSLREDLLDIQLLHFTVKSN